MDAADVASWCQNDCQAVSAERLKALPLAFVLLRELSFEHPCPVVIFAPLRS